MYVYLQPGRTLQGVVCKLAALRGGGQQPCPPTYHGGSTPGSQQQRGTSAATGTQRSPAIRFHPPPRSGLPRWPQQQLARCAPPRCRGSPSFVRCPIFASSVARGREPPGGASLARRRGARPPPSRPGISRGGRPRRVGRGLALSWCRVGALHGSCPAVDAAELA